MFAFQSIRQIFVATPAVLGLAGITVVLGMLATAPALAAEKTADVNRYCRKVHGRFALATIDRRDDGLMCTRPLRPGPGMLHRKIKAADVCADQHRTRRARREGLRLTCITGSGGGTQAVKSVDLRKYCRRRYGPKAFVTRRLTDDRPMCTVPVTGGQRHHLIDLASLCGGGSPRAVGKTLKCSPGTTAGGGGTTGGGDGNGRGATPGGGKGTGQPKSGPLPRPRRVGGGPITLTDIRGCGGIDPAFKKNWYYRGPDKKAGWGRGGVPLPCPGIAGGRAVDLAAYCRAIHRGPLRKKRGVFFWNYGKWPGCLPAYLYEPWKEDPSLLERKSLMTLELACKWASGMTPMEFSNANLQVVTKYVNRRLECFYFPLTLWISARKSIRPKPPTTGKARYRIEFVTASRPRKVLAKLRPGLRFIVRLVYKRDPGGKTKPVTLRQLKGGASIRLTARRVKRTNVFETGVVRLRAKVSP